MITGWIDPRLLRDFQAEGTDAHRLCTIEDGWVERFGSDVLISFKRLLARGRQNFALNNLSTIDHRFITDDVRSVLPRLARKGEKFDSIILDPPTFSRSPEGKTFRVQDDLEGLLISALAVAKRDAHVLVSTNCSALGER